MASLARAIEVDARLTDPRRHHGPGPHKSGSPQAIHGSGGPMTLAIARQGGASIKVDGTTPSDGFMVARPPQFGQVVTAEEWFDHGNAILDDFVMQRRDIYEVDPKAFIGVWWDKRHREFALDVSENVGDRLEAIKMGREWDQQAIWDVVNMTEIDTGGTGGRSATFGHPTAGGVLHMAEGEAAGVVPERRGGDAGGLRGRGRVDPEVEDALAEFWRHLAGQHDQSKHGRRLSGVQSMVGPGVTQIPLPPAARKRVDALKKKWGLDDEGLAEDYDKAFQSSTAVQYGGAWYAKEMGDEIEGLSQRTGVSTEVAAASIAITSARNRWMTDDGRHTNTETAEALIRTAQEHPEIPSDQLLAQFPTGYMAGNGFGLNVVRVVRGESTVDEAITGAKRRSFYNNGMDPTGSWDVTNDTIMAQTLAARSGLPAEKWAGKFSEPPPKYLVDAGITVSPAYIIATEAVLAAHARNATSVGFDLPHQTQATIWEAKKDGVI